MHFVYMLYPVRIFPRFRLKSSSSCNSFQTDRSLWSCATQCFKPGRCCKRALPLCCLDLQTSDVCSPSGSQIIRILNVSLLNSGIRTHNLSEGNTLKYSTMTLLQSALKEFRLIDFENISLLTYTNILGVYLNFYNISTAVTARNCFILKETKVV